MSEAPVTAGGPIIVFDALCVLCSASSQFVLRHDTTRRFRLASIQGDVGNALYRAHGLDPAEPETMIVVDGPRLLRDSDAVVAICEGCGWTWRAASVLRFVPRALRDPAYRWIARNRYRIFGKRDACWMPSAADRDRVI